MRIKKITNDLFAFNLKRKKIENIAMKKFEYEKFENNKGIIFYLGNNIPEGIIGIIASKLKEYYNKPTIVFSQYGNLLKGSARSIPSFNISQYINLAIEKSILISGGGHNLAAGMSLKKMNLNIFKNFLNQNYLKKEKSESNKYFSKISFTSLNFHLLNELNKFEPFGNQNNKIIFLIEKVRIIKPTIIKDKFISCFIKTKMNKLIKAISFNHIDSHISMNLLSQKNEINILAKISKNNWNNKTNIQLEIVDLISNNT